jgi:small multidrug resistance pump
MDCYRVKVEVHMGYFLLFIAIVMEVCGTTCMKLSAGFTRLVPSVLIFVFYALAFVVFTRVLKYMEVSIAYAIWAGLGIVLIGVIGMVHFQESVSAMKLACMAMVIAGSVGLSLSGVHG